VLVNNAAVARIKPLSEFSEPEIDLMFVVNAKEPIWGCQPAQSANVRRRTRDRHLKLDHQARPGVFATCRTTGICGPWSGTLDSGPALG
jgi:NAD(P)-dependent dehydrogenase (short-subunit alcohol dehydrogenase family)